MKKPWTHYLGMVAVLTMLLIFLVLPVGIFLLLKFGFPPVIGNLAAARAMERYADQVHPEWKASGHWAGYNLVSNGYYLSFSSGGGEHLLESGGGLITDEAREAALREELDIDGIVRRAGLWIPDKSITMWNAGWSPQAPEEALISVDVLLSPYQTRRLCEIRWPTKPWRRIRPWPPIVPCTDFPSITTTGEQRANGAGCSGTKSLWNCPRGSPWPGSTS